MAQDDLTLVLLAAGGSTRMGQGRDKLLEPMERMSRLCGSWPPVL